MEKRGQANLIGAILLIVVLIAITTSYVLITGEMQNYQEITSKVNNRVIDRGKEDVWVVSDHNNKLLHLINRGEKPVHITRILQVNNDTGKVIYRKVNIWINPMENKSMYFPDMLEYPPWVLAVVTDLGNIFWDKTYVYSSSGSANLNEPPAISDPITKLNSVSPLSYSSWDIIGDHIAYILVSDIYSRKYLYLFNVTSGEVISVNYISSGDKRIKIYVTKFNDLSLRYAYVDDAPIELPYAVKSIRYVGYDYIIMTADYYIEILYSNKTLLTYPIRVADKDIKIEKACNDLVIYSDKDNYLQLYRIRNGRVIYEKYLEKPYLFNTKLILDANRYVSTYIHSTDTTTLLLIPDNSTAPDIYENKPALTSDYSSSGIGNRIYAFNYNLQTFILNLYSYKDSINLSYDNSLTYVITHYFLYKDSYNHFRAIYRVSLSNTQSRARFIITVSVEKISDGQVTQLLTYSIYGIQYNPNHYSASYIIKLWTTVIIQNPHKSTSKVAIISKAYGYVYAGGYTSNSDKHSLITTYNAPYPQDAGYNSPIETELKLWYDDPYRVALLNLNQISIDEIINGYIIYNAVFPYAVFKSQDRLYMIFTHDKADYKAGIYSIEDEIDYGYNEWTYPPGFYSTVDGYSISKIMDIPGMDEYGKSTSILICNDEIWVVYTVPNKLVIIHG